MLGTLNDAQIDALLHSETVGRIGCVVDGEPYIVPVTYAYDGEAVYAHSAEGMKLRGLRKSPRACFEVEHVHDLANWRSVIAWGTFEELHGAAAERGMRVLVDKLTPLAGSETAAPAHGAEPRHESAVIYRIRLDRRTGRFEKR